MDGKDSQFVLLGREEHETSELSSNYGASNTDSYLMMPQDYKSNFAPLAHTEADEPFTVLVNIEVWAITEMSLQKQEIQLDMRVSVEWFDHRLTLSPNIPPDRTWLRLSKSDVNRIWKPSFLFRNCIGCETLSFSRKPNTELYIERETKLLFAKHRVLERFTCSINLRDYPMDIQTCSVKLYIYEETYDAMRLNHTLPNQLATILSNHTLSEYLVPPIIKTECTFDEDEEVYACVELKIRLEHLVTYHLMTSYIPTSFIVILSWISFWLPIDMVPARVALGLTSILTLATRLDQAQKNLPPVAYVKAIDVWMFACIFLVSTSLCEFAITHYRWRQQKLALAALEPMDKVEVAHKPVLPVLRRRYVYNAVQPYLGKKEMIFPPPPPVIRKAVTKQKEGTIMDRISRVAFPVSFLFFNMVYWTYYLINYNA